jgi:flagellar basal-body rod protein FlgC
MAISAISIAASGMKVASARLSASASNIANMATTGAIPGTAGTVSNPVYQPVDVVTFDAGSSGQPAGAGYKVQRTNGYFSAYNPVLPYADAEGMIAVPNVDLVSEIVDTMQASLQFQASAKVVRAISETEKSTIDILA